MSMTDSQTLPSQENGTVDHTGKVFGPAQRNDYDPSMWAMMPYAGTQEILLNPEPGDRRRLVNTPAFIKPAASGHRLPALLTILHSIPMAREALLSRNHLLPDYGFEKDWWDGTAIKILKIVNVDGEGRPEESDDVIHEIQRLIALLDETERAYGSADVLAALDGLRLYDHDKVTKFFELWHAAIECAGTDLPLTQTFKSKGAKTDPSDANEMEKVDFYCLTISVDPDESSPGATLYTILDHMLWNDCSDDEVAYFSEVGEIFTIEITSRNEKGRGLGVEVPSVWYADRYLPSSVEQAKEMRVSQAAIRDELAQKDIKHERMNKFQSISDGKEVDASKLLAKSLEYLQLKAARNQNPSEPDEMEAMPDTKITNSSISYAEAAEELQALTAKISKKLEAFERTREQAQEKLKELSQLYTKPSENPDEPPHHEYTLRGVSTTSHTTYVLEPAKPDADEMLSTELNECQWWKLEFLSTENKPVVQAKVTEEEVLTAAGAASSNALLVYATERAVSYPAQGLPRQLRKFIRADNLSFASELEGNTQIDPPTPSRSPKRKANDEALTEEQSTPERPPPYDRTHKTVSKADASPPSYYDHASPPALPQRRPITRKPVSKPGSYDDMIPTSLRKIEPVSDSTSMTTEPARSDGQGQEMQERGSLKSLLQSKNPYRTYKPDIDMEDG